MAIFSGKIIEAYFTNPEHKTIEVIYKEGEKAIAHFLTVDYEHPDYKDLIKEYDLEIIQKNTEQRSKKYEEQAKKAVKDLGLQAWKKANKDQNNEIIKKNVIENEMINLLLKFNENDKQHTDFLFSIKLNIFETDEVKNSKDESIKTKIRQSKTPLDVINESKKLFAK
jgi:hypothetical protein